MRVGFAAGDEEIPHAFLGCNVAAPQVPVPLQQWRSPPMATRRMSRGSASSIASSSISPTRSSAIASSYARPAGGFCVWLDVSDRSESDEGDVCELYRDAGVRVIHGSYLARRQDDGSNPGAGYIRLALVSDSESTAEALHRLVETLD